MVRVAQFWQRPLVHDPIVDGALWLVSLFPLDTRLDPGGSATLSERPAGECVVSWLSRLFYTPPTPQRKHDPIVDGQSGFSVLDNPRHDPIVDGSTGSVLPPSLSRGSLALHIVSIVSSGLEVEGLGTSSGLLEVSRVRAGGVYFSPKLPPAGNEIGLCTSSWCCLETWIRKCGSKANAETYPHHFSFPLPTCSFHCTPEAAEFSSTLRSPSSASASSKVWAGGFASSCPLHPPAGNENRTLHLLVVLPGNLIWVSMRIKANAETSPDEKR
ncbi:hypothetical protein V8F20_005350 [Naviculisporaceae sp. PSN 640]